MIAQSILPEFDHEMATTRKVIERLPEDKHDWKPHPKSMSLGDLTNHLINIAEWGVVTLKQESFDFAPVGGPQYKTPDLRTKAARLAKWDKDIADCRSALMSISDEAMMKPWSLLAGGKVIFSMPRVATFRSFVLSHNIHHRAQLCIYLRLNDIPVPSVYGPSADEGSM
ncbi:MAG TPA: DinB family protein [Planctomycetota bacterium]|nr:DinB family protein [Planctomycetota bacterium]